MFYLSNHERVRSHS